MVFDCMTAENKMLFTWQYIFELLCLLHLNYDDIASRYAVYQELSDVCQMAYSHVQSIFLRAFCVGLGKNSFKRTGTIDQAVNYPKRLKDKPEKLATRNSLLYHLLCLAQPETSAASAVELVSRVLIDTSRRGQDSLEPPESEALTKLAQVVFFIHNLCLNFAIPSASQADENHLISGIKQVDSSMAQARPHLNIDRFWEILTIFPTGRNVKRCLAALDACTRAHAGTSLEEAYGAVVNNCLIELKSQLSTSRLEPQLRRNAEPLPVPETPTRSGWPVPEPKEEAKLAATYVEATKIPTPILGKKKEKRVQSTTESQPKRPILSTAKYSVQPTPQADVASASKIRVSAATAQVFSILFDKSLSRSGLHWASFEAAMAELNFRISPRQGSSILFEPPASLGPGRSLTIHRPHGSRVEGFRTVILRQRLTRSFGWDNETFAIR
ncbi:hypothetical protein V2A60_000488 [Cordyceps javanica]